MIRLQRVGRKNDPSFRVVVVDSHRSTKTGKVLEVLGNYDARSAKSGQARPTAFNAERVKHWLAVGAQASATVHNLLVDKKIVPGKKVNALPKRKPVTETPAVAAA